GLGVLDQSIAQGHTIFGGANDLDKFVLRDSVTRLAAKNVVQSGLGAAFITQPNEVLEGIRNPPAGEEVDRNIEFVLGRHVRRTTVPFENSIVDWIDVLDERRLEL